MNYEFVPLMCVNEGEIKAATDIANRYFELSGMYNKADYTAREQILQDMRALLEKKKRLIEKTKNSIS